MGSGGYIYQISIHAPRVGCDEHCMSTPKTSWTFQSTHPVWGATGFLMVTVRVAKFQSTHPVWGATEWLGQKFLDDAISIHAPRVGCDPEPDQADSQRDDFNPRTPCGVRQDLLIDRCAGHQISIHAPRVGCDDLSVPPEPEPMDFNPRTPCGVRLVDLRHGITEGDFNPRTPCGVRLREPGNSGDHGHFNPRTPCGVRRRAPHVPPKENRISIHAPRVGCDAHRPAAQCQATKISIHAPRVGCDSSIQFLAGLVHDFNPRTPCGVRPGAAHQVPLPTKHFNPRTPCGVRPRQEELVWQEKKFQSTHPVWGATSVLGIYGAVQPISIHAPRVGCDV